MKRRVRQLREVALYLLMPAANFLSPLLVIPAVTYRFGSAGWTTFAVAQSLGASIAVATEMGWGVVGPQRVAALPHALAVEQYRLSITSRLITALPGMVVAAVAAAIISHSFKLEAALLAAAFAAQAMTPSWYFVGIAKPFYIFLSEAFPRMCIALTCGLAIRFGAPLALYSTMMLVSVILTQLIARRLIGPDSRLQRTDWARAWSTSRAQWVMGTGRAASVIYTALPITIVQVFAPGATAVYAASERLMRMGLQVLGTIPLRLQSWVGSATGLERAQRIARARRYMLLMGLASGLLFAVAAPTASRFIFSGKVDVPYYVSAASGALMCFIVISTSLGLSLVAQRQANDITRAILPSAAVGLISIGPLAALAGPVGAIVGAMLAEGCGILIQRHYLVKGHASWLHSLEADKPDMEWR